MGPELASRADSVLNLKAKGLQMEGLFQRPAQGSVKVLISSRLPDNQE